MRYKLLEKRYTRLVWNNDTFKSMPRMSRKLKKYIVGKKVNKRTLNALLSNVTVSRDGISSAPEITPDDFCPKCGTYSYFNVENGIRCSRCNFKLWKFVEFTHYNCLEFRENNFVIPDGLKDIVGE